MNIIIKIDYTCTYAFNYLEENDISSQNGIYEKSYLKKKEGNDK